MKTIINPIIALSKATAPFALCISFIGVLIHTNQCRAQGGVFVPIGVGSSVFSQGTYNAPPSPPDPSPCHSPFVGTLWLGLTATNSGKMHIDTEGSAIFTRLGVYLLTGAPEEILGTNPPIICDQSSALVGQQCHVTFDAIEGTNYTIVVEGYQASGTIKVTSTMFVPPTIQFTNHDAAGYEQGVDPANFVVRRIGFNRDSLVVNYAVSGTATPGADYTALSGSVTIPALQDTAAIVVQPIDDAVAEAPFETVVATLQSSTNYVLGSPSFQGVAIYDNEVTTVTISATDATAGEGGDPGVFTITRAGYTGGALTVYYSVGGTAANGYDYYGLSGSKQIPAGQSSVTISITPFEDEDCEGNETVTLTLQSGYGYQVAAPNQATVTIYDNDVGCD